MPTWYSGREAVAGFLRRMPLSQELRWRVLPAPASGQVGLGYYLYSEESGTFLPHGVNVLTLHGARIAEIVAFLTPETFGRFGLPAAIQP
jgi:hypothetical protein